MPEKHLEAALESFFRRRVQLVGGYTVKLAPTEAGIPDRLAMFPGGRMYLVELKAQNGQLSPIQRVLHDRLKERTGVEVVVLYGRDEVTDWIRRVISAADPKSKRRRPAARV